MAEEARVALARDPWVPKTVSVRVHRGWVTLEGEVDWIYELESPEPVVRRVLGVMGVTNLITKTSISRTAAPTNVQSQTPALAR